MKKIFIVLFLLIEILCSTSFAQNKSDREQWLIDAGFGMFIHWSFDSQLGVVISHSMVGASDEYLNRYINELPKTFNPHDFSPTDIARLAKLAGMKYVVFTTKHHSGFCMWDTKTTDFKITKTPYGKDLLAEYVKAVRDAGLGVGFYYSPEDFSFLHKYDQLIIRKFFNKQPVPEDVTRKYVEFTEAQCRELFTQYGKIDILFIDGAFMPTLDKTREVAWKLQPDIIVTRGAIATPEKTLMGSVSEKPWEACMTMGTSWGLQYNNEKYKSAKELINMLVETRATGGTLLLNIGPDSYGRIVPEQENRLRDMALWYFVNHEAVDSVRPWVISHEGDIWFTRKKDKNEVFLIFKKQEDWERATRKEFFVKTIKPTADTKISVLGQSDEVTEYIEEMDVKSKFEMTDKGLKISVVKAQRLYDATTWPHPVVVKLTNVEPAFLPPAIITLKHRPAEGGVQLNGEIKNIQQGESVSAGFQYRTFEGDPEDKFTVGEWIDFDFKTYSANSFMSVVLKSLKAGSTYQFRTVVKHPKMLIEGDIKTIKL